MTSKPSEPQDEQAVEPKVDAPETTLNEENLDQVTGGAWPLPTSKYINTGPGG